MNSTITPSKIRQLQERVAKHAATADAEQAELVRLTDARRKMMSLRNPRGRQIVRDLRATERRLHTARERVQRAEQTLEAARLEAPSERAKLESNLEALRIDTVLAQRALADGDAAKVAYYLPRLTKWAEMVNGTVA